MKYVNLVTVILLILELGSVISIGWFLVFLPTIIWFGLLVLALLGVLIVAVLANKYSR